MALTSTQLDTIASKLLFMQEEGFRSLLPAKTTTGPGSIAAKFAAIESNDDFKRWGIGVLDFTSDPISPAIWLHNESTPWRIGSTGKLAIILAAAQLRADVRAVQATHIVSTPEQFDDLFAMGDLWRRSIRVRDGARNAGARACDCHCKRRAANYRSFRAQRFALAVSVDAGAPSDLTAAFASLLLLFSACWFQANSARVASLIFEMVQRLGRSRLTRQYGL